MALRPLGILAFSIVVLVHSPVHPASGHHPAAGTGPHDRPASCPFVGAPAAAAEWPEQIGQDAFAALAEMRGLLTADPDTDWSRVNLDALREHLVDMNRVVLDAEVSVRPVPEGFEAHVTGVGRTLDAIRRMIPAHARFADGRDGLRVTVSDLAQSAEAQAGVIVTVTAADPSQVERVRGLGFFGFLVAGDHHRPHHLAMAIGKGHP